MNGYSGYGTPLQEFLGGAASPLNDLDRIEDALELLRAIGVRYVLVHPRDFADPAVGADTAAAIAARSTLVVGQHSAPTTSSAFRLRDGAIARSTAAPAAAGHASAARPTSARARRTPPTGCRSCSTATATRDG